MPRTAVLMPKMSMTMEEGELASWHVGVGDTVAEGQVVCEVLTDKVDMEVESPARGTVVGIDVGEGDTVPVGTPLAWIESDEAGLMDGLFGATDAGAVPVQAAAPEPVPSPAPEPAAPAEAAARDVSGRVRAMPGARREAAARGLDLGAVAGSGPGGAVMLRDLPDAAPQLPDAAPQLPAAEPDALWAARAAALVPRPGADLDSAPTVLSRDVVLARSPELPEASRVRAHAVRAAATALAAAGPAAVRQDPRVALVLQTPAGPVPVTITGADRLDADACQALLGEAEAAARAGTVDVRFLAPPDLTVTVLEQVGAAVVPARGDLVAALALGAVQARAVAVGDGVAVRPVVTATLTPGRRAGEVAEPGALAALLAHVCAHLAASVGRDASPP